MPNNRNLRDAQLKISKALPASTTAIHTDAFDLKTTSRGDFVAEAAFLFTAPALTTSQLPDAKVMVYTVEIDTDSAFSSPSPTIVTLGTQTGAGGAGAVATTYRFVPPDTAQGYLRGTVTPSASGTGDASAASVTIEVLV